MFSRHSASSLHSPRWQLTVKLSPHKNQTFISNLRCWYVLRGKNWSKRFKHEDLKEAGLKQLEWMKSIIYLFQIKMTGRERLGKMFFSLCLGHIWSLYLKSRDLDEYQEKVTRENQIFDVCGTYLHHNLCCCALKSEISCWRVWMVGSDLQHVTHTQHYTLL